MKTKNLVCPMAKAIPINSTPVISLSDGSKLQDMSMGVTPGSGSYQFEATYSPMPSNVQNVTFNLDCLWQTSEGSSLWTFEIPLRLTANANVDLTIAPVVEIPAEISPNAEPGVEDRSSLNGNMVVNEIIPLEDGYILQGSLTVKPENGLIVDIFNGYLEDATILDANNLPLMPAMVPGDFIVESNEPGSDQYHWAIQVNGTDIAWPLTITVNSIPAVTEPYPTATFQVDVGEIPVPGQEWVIEKDVPLGPKMVHVVSMKRVQNPVGMNGYEITFISDPSLSFSFGIEGGVATGGGGQGGGVDGDRITITRSYKGEVPTGVLTVQLDGQGIKSIPGPWQVTLQEPVY